MSRKKKYLIDGRFLSSMTTGIDRYAFQILRELDKICADLDISILVPGNAKVIPDYKNIKVIKLKHTRNWTQMVFGPYARLHGFYPVNLCNEVSKTAPKGIVCLHDVCYAESEDIYPGVSEFPEDEIKWFKQVYKRIARHTEQIITVSEFSKTRICELLNIPQNKITVIGNGWQHFNDIEPDVKIFEKYPKLKKKEYFFTLTSPNKNKNVEWILECAKKNDDKTFVLAGKNLDKIINQYNLENIVYIGYADDVTAKTLMMYCRAFIFPSYYEGFGIPPMEALSTGSQIIVSNAASLPEVFGSTAHYISPYEPYVDLDELLLEKTSDSKEVLDKYSWKNSASRLCDLLKKNN